jgi:NAD(P)-dependent dehydrogenase (short-subunit alcohol dehydrogenase family)
MSDLTGKTILITGGARRIGRALALAVAEAGADVILHYGYSQSAAQQTASDIRALGRQVRMLQADLNLPDQVPGLIRKAMESGPLYGLVNNAAIFEQQNWADTTLEAWERHLNINLTAPFLLSQAFAKALAKTDEGRIINILDWRALRPGADHFPYTISKAGLVAVTQSLAVALAPRICVNGLALGAILPPSDNTSTAGILDSVPAGRWARLEEVGQALIFLLTGPAYITGDILYLDGGRHLI